MPIGSPFERLAEEDNPKEEAPVKPEQLDRVMVTTSTGEPVGVFDRQGLLELAEKMREQEKN